jgi:hypothetical protein
LGEIDDAPMFTITHHDVRSLPRSAPTASYLRWIALGLREAHGYDDARIARYLAPAPGISGAWTERALRAIVGSGSGAEEPVKVDSAPRRVDP